MVWKHAKYSEERPQVNPENPYEDPVALIELREWALRRKYIDIEKAKVNPGLSNAQLAVTEVSNSKARDRVALLRRSSALQLVREKLRHCYITEGVNNRYKCRELVDKYFESIQNIGVHVANAGKSDLGRAEARAKLLEES